MEGVKTAMSAAKQKRKEGVMTKFDVLARTFVGGVKVAMTPRKSERDPKRLRAWLPKRTVRNSGLNAKFVLILVAAVFTAIFTKLSMDGGVLSAGDQVADIRWIYETGGILASVFLGFCASTWWTDWKTGDRQQLSVVEIDNKIEEEMHWISINLSHIRSSINLLDDPHEEFLKATHFMLQTQIGSVEEKISQMALQVDQLGYSSSEFLDEKKTRYIEIRTKVRELVQLLPKNSGLQEIEEDLTRMIESPAASLILRDRVTQSGEIETTDASAHRGTDAETGAPADDK